jgi:hypothetical protein
MDFIKIDKMFFDSDSSAIKKTYLSDGILIFSRVRNNICAWNYNSLRDNFYDASVLESAFNGVFCDKWEGAFYNPSDILVIDSDGNVLLKNFNAEVVKDLNGFIHISEKSTSLKSLVKAFSCREFPQKTIYFVASEFKDLNYRIKDAVQKKIINRPSGFNMRSGLKEKPIFDEKQREIL